MPVPSLPHPLPPAPTGKANAVRRYRSASALLLACALFGVSLAAPASGADPARTVLNPPQMPNTTQYGYSQATVVATGTRLVFVSGQVGWVEGAQNDFRSQVDRAFANLAAALEAAESAPGDVVRITLLIADHDPTRLAYLVEKRRAFFGASPPASTLIPVPALYAPGVSFEIDAVAVAAASR